MSGKRPTAIIAALVVLSAAVPASPARGPLRVHPTNSRYFTDGSNSADGSAKAVYLTGSHTWSNLIDRGPGDPPPTFDFNGYLQLLAKHQHNFIRLWSRHVTWYHGYGSKVLHAAPLVWLRTGPGNALDAKPQFDLNRFNEAYFNRLRGRVIAARDRGIYVSLMLFGGSYECRGGWRGNPFNAHNNINGVDGDENRDGEGLESQALRLPAVTRLQEAYVRKVIDAVNDLDNVLYEISNESDDSSREWQFREMTSPAPDFASQIGVSSIWSISLHAAKLSRWHSNPGRIAMSGSIQRRVKRPARAASKLPAGDTSSKHPLPAMRSCILMPVRIE